MTKKYLLSTGKSTDKLEVYIVDLIKLYLQIWPDDIPGASGMGFDFIITNTMKSELPGEVKRKVSDLVSRIQARFKGVSIEVSDITLLNEKQVKITLSVNHTGAEEITINLFNEE